MEIKSRSIKTPITGFGRSSVGQTSFATEEVTQSQRTLSHTTGWPMVQHALRSGLVRGTGAEWVFTHRDWGAAFITQTVEVSSSQNALGVSASKGNILPVYEFQHKGPCFLAGHSMFSLYSDLERSNAEQALWMKGAEAIRIARPNKPQIDVSVLLGELRKEGIPSMIGSIAGRSQTLMELFRSSGKEYLNLQFGWIPLLRDITALVQLIPESRRLLEQYERDIDRLVRRRYHFPVQVDVSNTLDQPDPAHAIYRRATGTPWGYPPEDHVTFRSSGQVPEQVTRTTTRTWFAGGFRFYHRSVPEALQELSLFEERANLLLGTRLDPEVLWNLAPWTWLSDWFINFGDVVGNASALLSDDLVMQYGYLMRTTHEEKTISWPQGLWARVPTGSTSSGFVRQTGPYSQTVSRVTKQRGKASPFGFGFTDSDFTEHQLAILAALGLSRK
jgi:hypothetical protein